jgi:hypothetical protein
MNTVVACVIILCLLKILFFIINKKPQEKNWNNKPFSEELTYEEKRLLILGLIKPRSRNTRYGWEAHQQDIVYSSMLQRFTISYSLGSLTPDQSIQMSGEMVSATPEVIRSSSEGARTLYNYAKNEFKIDLIKLAQRDLEGADLSRDPLL